MAQRVRITDVAPRDGLQNEAAIVAPTDKVVLVTRLALAGVDEVEVTSFVSPRWIPQLSDAEEVMGLVRGEAMQKSMRRPVYSALVPNEKGFERALAFHDPEGGFPLKIALFAAASETFSRKNTNGPIAEVIERFRPIVPRATAAGMSVRLYISCAVACPFEGPTPPERVRAVADALLGLFDGDAALARAELDLGDTIGVATPAQIRALIGAFDPWMRERITLHLHDTHGMAASCVRAALDLGVLSFDGAAGGLGGCPYASTPQKRAPGNIATELLVATVHGAGFTTRVDPDALAEAGAFAQGLVSAARAGGSAS